MGHDGAWARSDRKDRLPANWPALTNAVFRRDGRICHKCGGDGADGVDHVEAGDDHSLANLKPIHHHQPPYCHRYKSSEEGRQKRQAMRAARTRPAERHPLDQESR